MYTYNVTRYWERINIITLNQIFNMSIFPTLLGQASIVVSKLDHGIRQLINFLRIIHNLTNTFKKAELPTSCTLPEPNPIHFVHTVFKFSLKIVLQSVPFTVDKILLDILYDSNT